MRKVLFLCRANIGRSQMAEVMARRILAPDFAVASAGTKAVDKDGKSREGLTIGSFGDAAAPLLSVMLEDGFDISEARIKQLTPEMISNSDLVISMAEIDSEPDYLKESPKLIRWRVTDPKGMNEKDTREIKNLIYKHIMDFKNYTEPKDIWFKQKKYGLGWTPANWKGWTTFGLFIAIVLITAFGLDETSTLRDIMFTIARLFAWLIIFLFIAFKKGEKLEWKWGNKKNES